MKVPAILLALLARAVFLALFLSAGSVPAQTVPEKDFRVKGFHLDMRIQVMPMPALRTLATDLRKKGINTLLVEWEASYPFKDEPIIANRYAYTRSEIVDFTRYCQSIGLDVIPLQQSFGHVEYILRHARYAQLREDDRDLSQVCPAQTDLNKELFTTLYKDLISTHTSPYIHIGCDETHLLGHCPRCQKLVAEEGLSKLYFNHLKMLCDIVISLGKIPVLWADIALKYPEYIKLLPKQTILVDWNYGWAIDRFGSHTALANSGYEVWGAPALRSDPDNYYLTRWQYHFNNISTFIPQCAQFGYKGVIMTSWSTSGEYDAAWDGSGDLKDLYAVRHVYPITGFHMLVDAFIDALARPESFDRDKFIIEYCRQRYGLNEASANLFKTALFTTPYKVVGGKVLSPTSLSLTALLDSARMAATILDTLHPIKNQTEFEHYRLMARIRVYYLTYLNIEAQANAASNPDDLKKYIAQLKTLMATEPALDEDFRRLNKDALYPAAIEEENTIRTYRAHRLFERLAGITTFETKKNR
ncbi:MAG TPA: family 20 glycosylhydrolase [Puia sp.]|nr:family 20 glycosylhydrolase [Puia sp.]